MFGDFRFACLESSTQIFMISLYFHTSLIISCTILDFIKINFYLIVTFCSLIIIGCRRPPEVCMELSAESTFAGTPIQFASCSKRALSFEWFMDGPDGAPENIRGWSDESFSHSFTVPGSYVITLNVSRNFSFTGDKATLQKTIRVN